MTMAKNFSSSAQLLLVLLVTMAFVSGILARGTPSRCSGGRNPALQSLVKVTNLDRCIQGRQGFGEHFGLLHETTLNTLFFSYLLV
ncbi:unnamed protein product [Urochloa humidicola]